MKNISHKFIFPFSHLSSTQKAIIAIVPMIFLALLKPCYPTLLLKAPILIFYPAVLFSTWLCGGLAGFYSLFASLIIIFSYIRPELVGEMRDDHPLIVRFTIFYLSISLFQLLVGTLENSLKKAKASIKDRDAFLSTVSHELRTPITTIKLQLEVLKEQMKEKDLSLSAAKSIERQIYRQNKLVNSMLDLAMIESGDLGLKTEKWNLAEIVDLAVRNAAEIMNVGEVRLNLRPSIISCDGKRVEQSVYNLVHNALKYGERGSVEVSLSSGPDFATIEISNTGTPIENKFQSEIFKKMKRPEINDQVQGLGIGLYLARHLIELHGGKIDLSSNPQKTTFLVKLPLEVNV